jgi:Trk K+ transport system NAD-binding subunit
MPSGALIVFLERNNEYVVPGGRTVLRQGDRLHVLAERRVIGAVDSLFKSESTAA